MLTKLREWIPWRLALVQVFLGFAGALLAVGNDLAEDCRGESSWLARDGVFYALIVLSAFVAIVLPFIGGFRVGWRWLLALPLFATVTIPIAIASAIPLVRMVDPNNDILASNCWEILRGDLFREDFAGYADLVTHFVFWGVLLAITPAEAAALLGVASAKFVRRWRAQNAGASPRGTGRPTRGRR